MLNLANIIKNPKTSAYGLLSFILVVIPQVMNLLDDNPETVFSWEIVTAAGLAALGLSQARDGDKSSENQTE